MIGIRLRAWALAVILVASIVAGLLNSTSVSAAGEKYQYDLLERSKAYVWGSWLVACYTGMSGFDMSSSGAGDGTIYAKLTGKSFNLNPILSPDIITPNCNDSNKIKQALDYFGISTYDFICDILGGQRHNGADCKDTGSTADWTIPTPDGTKVKNGMVSKVGFDVFNVIDAQRYVFFRQTFIAGCEVKDPAGTALSAITNPSDAAVGDLRYQIKSPNADASALEPYVFNTGKGGKVNISFVAKTNPVGFSSEYNCETLAKNANDYADAYLKFLKTLPTCDNQYQRDGVDVIAACQYGFSQKGSGDPIQICATKYPAPDGPGGPSYSRDPRQKAFYDACYWGATSAYAASLSGAVTLQDGAKGNQGNVAAKSTCGITGVGWIICPVMTFLSEVMDNTFKFLADSFLSTDPEVFKIGSPTQKAWSIFLSYANVGFVIAFMIIIYSQITSAGISNYGIKKMLPKLIVSAILVNISYYLCQAAIDLSNVLGYSIMNLFSAIAKDPSIASSTAATLNWNGTITAILAGGAAIGLLVAVGGTFLLAALLAAATVVLILLARKALLILLVVLAPLAFVAYLLPNTSSLFTKWRKMFTSLLLVFPIVALLFGASKLAAAIISSSDPSNTVAQLMALAIAVIPLFAVVPLLKGAVNAIPVVGSKLQGWGNKATGRASAAGKKGLGDAYQNSTLGRYNKYKAGEKSKRNSLIQAGVYKGKGGVFNPRNLRSKSRNRFNNSWVSGGFGDKTAAAGAAAASKIEQEEVDNEVTKMGKSFSGPDQELKEATDAYNAALHSGDVVRARAAQKILLSKGSAGVQAIRDVVGGKKDSAGNEIYKGLSGIKNGAVSYARSDLASAGIKGKDAGLNTWSYDDKNRDLADVDASASTYTGLTDSELAGQSAAVLRAAVAAGHIDRARRDAMLANQTIEAQLSEDKKAILR